LQSVKTGLTDAGALGLFSALNIVAFVMVFLFVEETKRRTLEELDHIFAVSKKKFMRFQLFEYLPWLIRYHLFGSPRPRPELYENMIWGPAEGEDLAPFRAADFIGRDPEPAAPEPVELANSNAFDFPLMERRAKAGDYDMMATNNAGPVSPRF
jgi:hypothetical protein